MCGFPIDASFYSSIGIPDFFSVDPGCQRFFLRGFRYLFLARFWSRLYCDPRVFRAAQFRARAGGLPVGRRRE